MCRDLRNVSPTVQCRDAINVNLCDAVRLNTLPSEICHRVIECPV